MAMVVKNNLQAKNTLNQLGKNDKAKEKNLKALATGMKINSAGDDASGLSISERMEVQIRGLDQDNDNAQTGANMPVGGTLTYTLAGKIKTDAKDGATITIEPWRSAAFPVIKDLVVNRSAYDQILQAGGFISSNTGSAPEAHSTPAPKREADKAFDNATCIGCGACVAACPNSSAMLFTSAKITHLAMLPQGQPERYRRVKSMVAQHDEEGFGNCTNIGECAAVCPKGIPLESIAQLNRDLIAAMFKRDGK